MDPGGDGAAESPECLEAEGVSPPGSACGLSSLAVLKDRKKRNHSPEGGGGESLMVAQSKRQRPRPASPPLPPSEQTFPVQNVAGDWGFYTELLTPANALRRVGSPPCGTRSCFVPGQFECDSNGNGSRGAGGRNVSDEELVDAITAILENICSINNGRIVAPATVDGTRAPYRSAAFPDGSSSIYFSLQKPGVEMRYYVARLVKYLNVSSSVFIVALIYLDRVHAADEVLALQDLNVHRLITTALTLSCKFIEDEVHRNSTICRIGGVPSTAEMNLLEAQFLRRIGWNCAIDAQQYELYRSNVFKSRAPAGARAAPCPSVCSETPPPAEEKESPRGVATRALRQ